MFQGPGRHDSRHRAPKTQEQGDESLAGKTQAAHDVFHDIGHPSHVPGIFQEAQGQEQDQDVGQEGDDGPHPAQDPVDDQGFQPVTDSPGSEQPFQPVPEPADEIFHVSLQHIPYRKGQEEHHRHDQQEHRNAPDPVREHLVQPVGDLVAFLLVEQHFVDDFFDKVVFFPDDLGLIVLVQDVRPVHRVLLHHFLVLFQQLDGVPPGIDDVRVFHFQFRDQLVDPVLDGVGIDHGVHFVVQPMGSDGLMVVDQRVRVFGIPMMDGRME